MKFNKFKILNAIKEVRNELNLKDIIEDEKGEINLEMFGFCRKASKLLLNKLKVLGYKNIYIVHGEYINELIELSGPHIWVELKSKYILDPTIDQFENPPYPWITLITNSKYHLKDIELDK